jgi:hypothetical protein
VDDPDTLVLADGAKVVFFSRSSVVLRADRCIRVVTCFRRTFHV